MNKYLIIGLIVVLAALLLLMLKAFVPSVRTAMERMPKWVMFLLIAIVFAAIVLLITSLIKTGGAPGTAGETARSETEQENRIIPESEIDNCIIVRADRVLINGAPADTEYIASYLNAKANEGVTVTVVDDFSLASLYRTILGMCEEKGVKYNTQDETWLEKQ